MKIKRDKTKQMTAVSPADERIMTRRELAGFALKLAMPIMIQNLISALVGTADTFMLGYVSQTAMSASSLANEFVFILMCFYYGMSTAASVLCAQYWGKGDRASIEKILMIGQKITFAISLLFFAVTIAVPEFIMRLYTQNPETIELGSRYLRVVAVSFVFLGISEVYLSMARSIGRVIFPSVACIVSLVVNIVMNATFIFGLFGAPKLGVVGVALGTVIARISEALLCIIHSFVNSDVRFRLSLIFRSGGILFKDFVKVCFPAIINDVIWSLATSVFASILGHMSDDVVAANAVAIIAVNIGAIACRGFANATTIVISQALGANRTEAAKKYGDRMLAMTIFVSVLGCGVIFTARPLLIAFYSGKLTATAIEYLNIMMVMTCWRLVGEGVNTCLICGCFRGGGDTRFGLVIDTLFMWLVAVPLMAGAAYILKLPPMWVYFVMTLDEYEKMPVVFIHYKRRKWLTNVTRSDEELAVQG